MSLDPRPYQDRAIHGLRQKIRDGKRALLLVAPTGSGKTVVAAHIILSARRKGKRILFFAHRRELIVQAYNKLIEIGIPPSEVGIMMADDPRTNPSAPIQVASIDTYRRREHHDADLVIVDEAHRSLSPTYLEVVRYHLDRGATVLGMTATPRRADGKGLGDVYEDLEVVATPQELIDLGYLVRPRVLTVPAMKRPDLSKVHTRAGDYDKAELEAAVNTSALVGNIVEHWLKHANGMRTVVFATSIAHSQHIRDRFVEAGIWCEHLDGTTPTKERDAILYRLEIGATTVVCSCGVLCEGWDMPAVKVAILARPTKSLTLYLQQAGRILRPYEGMGAIILDHAGNANAHGLPQATREWKLELTQPKDEKGELTKVCPECESLIPMSAAECPDCGYLFPRAKRKTAQERLGMLMELTDDEAIPQGSDEEIWWRGVVEWYAANRWRVTVGLDPMKPGWVWHRFIKRTGRKPLVRFPPPAPDPDSRELRAAYLTLLRIEVGSNQPDGWAARQYKECFGEAPAQLRRAS